MKKPTTPHKPAPPESPTKLRQLEMDFFHAIKGLPKSEKDQMINLKNMEGYIAAIKAARKLVKK